jgi:hypothetical protein
VATKSFKLNKKNFYGWTPSLTNKLIGFSDEEIGKIKERKIERKKERNKGKKDEIKKERKKERNKQTKKQTKKQRNKQRKKQTNWRKLGLDLIF